MLSKFRLFFVDFRCGPIVAFNLFISIIVFISTSIQVKFLGGNSFANILRGRQSINSLGIDLLTVHFAILLAIVSIVFLTLSKLLSFNSSLNDSFGALAGMTGLMGILHIMLSGILNTTPLFYRDDIHQIFRFAFLRTLE